MFRDCGSLGSGFRLGLGIQASGLGVMSSASGFKQCSAEGFWNYGVWVPSGVRVKGSVLELKILALAL